MKKKMQRLDMNILKAIIIHDPTYKNKICCFVKIHNKNAYGMKFTDILWVLFHDKEQ